MKEGEWFKDGKDLSLSFFQFFSFKIVVLIRVVLRNLWKFRHLGKD